MIVPLAIRRLDHAPYQPGHATTVRKHFLAAWAGVAGRGDLDAHPPGVAWVAAVRPGRHGPDVRALPGRGRGPQRATGCREGRPCRLVRPAAVGLAGRPAGRLPW